MQTVKLGLTMAATWAFSLLLVQGCGGDDDDKPSAAQVKDACVRICQKSVDCDPPPIAVDCNQFCSGDSADDAVPAKCQTNAVLGKVNACLDGTCAALEDCLGAATSGCDSGSGTGGSSSTGGSTSTGGIGSGTGGTTTGTGGAGSGDCSVCTKASTCCVALAAQTGSDAASCTSFTAAMCTAAGANQSVYISTCQSILMSGAALNIAACK